MASTNCSALESAGSKILQSEKMEGSVADYASKLLSDDMTILLNASKTLHEEINQSASSRVTTSTARLVQELAIYQQGSILKKFLKQIFEERKPLDSRPVESVGFRFTVQDAREGVAHASYLAITSLTASKSAALFTLREEGIGATLLRCFMENIPCFQARQRNERLEIVGLNPLLGPSLAGLVNYVRASEQFRRLIRGADSLLPSLQLLFLDEVIQKISPQALIKVMQMVAKLLLALVLQKDSQEWAIETGYIGLLASIFRGASRVQADDQSIEAVRTCMFVLLRTCELGIW